MGEPGCCGGGGGTGVLGELKAVRRAGVCRGGVVGRWGSEWECCIRMLTTITANYYNPIYAKDLLNLSHISRYKLPYCWFLLCSDPQLWIDIIF